MFRFQDAKEELDKTLAEYDKSLKQQQESFNEFQQCVNKFYWRRNSKCTGMFGSFKKAVTRSAVLEVEKDNLASKVPLELSTVKSMHSTCMQQANILKDMNNLIVQKGSIFLLFSESYKNSQKEHTKMLWKCAKLERTQEQLQIKGPEFKS